MDTTEDLQSALDAVNALGDSSTLPDEQRNELEMAIQAALTAQDVNAELLDANQDYLERLASANAFAEQSRLDLNALTATNAELLKCLTDALSQAQRVSSAIDDFRGRASAIDMIRNDKDELVLALQEAITIAVQRTRPVMCHANRDGECAHPDCPQLRDKEPSTSGRHCPLDVEED